MPRSPLRALAFALASTLASTLACTLAGLAGLACSQPDGSPAPAQPVRAQPGPPSTLLAPADGEVAAIVREEAAKGGGRLVVAVGAPWCEPCRAFHDALQAGELDAALAGVRFIEFDIDRDRERLAAAGYASRFIPLFALPGADGRASGRQIEGGIKGARAVEHIMRRLRPLLDRPGP